jgi:hypothetical protein
MKAKTLEEKVECYALLHKQNLNGRESEDQLFEAGILAGIEETIEERDEFAIEFAEWCASKYMKLHSVWCPIFGDQRNKDNWKTTKDLLEIFKKEKGL